MSVVEIERYCSFCLRRLMPDTEDHTDHTPQCVAARSLTLAELLSLDLAELRRQHAEFLHVLRLILETRK